MIKSTFEFNFVHFYISLKIKRNLLKKGYNEITITIQIIKKARLKWEKKSKFLLIITNINF